MLNKKNVGAIIVLLLFLVLIGYHCPIQKITGFPCPGCNMLTSAYWLLKGNLSLSLYYHALLIVTIVVFVVCLILHRQKKNKIRDGILFCWAILMIVYYIYRMITIFPDYPMDYDTNSLFWYLFRFIFR